MKILRNPLSHSAKNSRERKREREKENEGKRRKRDERVVTWNISGTLLTCIENFQERERERKLEPWNILESALTLKLRERARNRKL